MPNEIGSTQRMRRSGGRKPPLVSHHLDEDFGDDPDGTGESGLVHASACLNDQLGTVTRP